MPTPTTDRPLQGHTTASIPAAASDEQFFLSLYFGLIVSIYTAFNLWKSDRLPAGEWHFDDQDVLDIAMDRAKAMMQRRGEELGGQP